MPNTPSTKKNVRVAHRRRAKNMVWRRRVRDSVKDARKGSVKAEKASLLQSILDKAAKRGVIHKNKAARLKSSLFRASAHGKR